MDNIEKLVKTLERIELHLHIANMPENLRWKAYQDRACDRLINWYESELLNLEIQREEMFKEWEKNHPEITDDDSVWHEIMNNLDQWPEMKKLTTKINEYEDAQWAIIDNFNENWRAELDKWDFRE
jgi:hypothetical protein